MKIVNLEEISGFDTATAVTVGMFDGVHIGHRHLVARLVDNARKLKLTPIVITFDRHPREVISGKGVPLLTTVDERVRLLQDCGVENVIVVGFTRDVARLTACRFVESYVYPKLNMQYLLLGYDNMFGRRENGDFDKLPELAMRLGFAMDTDTMVVHDGVEVSSTTIRAALSKGDIEVATKLLGSPYCVDAEVVRGRQVGREIGFPTANMAVDPQKIMPREGVYALRALVDGKTYPAMVNVGAQPTFGLTTPVVEVNVIGYEGDLYGKHIVIEFIDRLRDTICFASVDELVAALENDRARAVELFKLK